MRGVGDAQLGLHLCGKKPNARGLRYIRDPVGELAGSGCQRDPASLWGERQDGPHASGKLLAGGERQRNKVGRVEVTVPSVGVTRTDLRL